MVSIVDYVAEQKKQIAHTLRTHGVEPFLAIIQVGDNPASSSYIKGKIKDCSEVGISYHLHKINDTPDFNQSDLEKIIKYCNINPLVDGIIVQLPLPERFDVEAIKQLIDPAKDVDGFGALSCFQPCTPKGIIDWMGYNNLDFSGKNCVVIGRSDIVGKPLVKMLIERGATVTCCNSKTKNIAFFLQEADYIFVAVGKAKMFNHTYFNDNHKTLIVDIGINRGEDGKLCGDVDKDDVESPNIYVTPVPHGVGLLTRLALIKNTQNSAMKSLSKRFAGVNQCVACGAEIPYEGDMICDKCKKRIGG